MSDLREARAILQETYELISGAYECMFFDPSEAKNKLEKAQNKITELQWELTLTEAFWRTTRAI